MLVFVSGPYSAETEEQKLKNVAAAANAGRDILALGHMPFVPHTMTCDWECDERLGYPQFLELCFVILRRCDALLYLAPSPGADQELALALELGLTVYRNIDEVPDISHEAALDEDALEPRIAQFRAAQIAANSVFTPPKGETITDRFISGCRRWLRKAGSLFTERWSERQLYREVEEEVQDAYSMLTAIAKTISVRVDHDLVCLVVNVLDRIHRERRRIEDDASSAKGEQPCGA